MFPLMLDIHNHSFPQDNNLVCKLESSSKTKVDFLLISKVVDLRVFVFPHTFHTSIIICDQLIAINLMT